MVMPDPDKLSTATGQLGPICSVTGKPITFSEAIVVDDKYVCYEAYVELTVSYTHLTLPTIYSV